MQTMREKAQRTTINVAGIDCAAVVFAIYALDVRPAADVIARRRSRSNARYADSESRFLATKKFFVRTGFAPDRRSPNPAFCTNRLRPIRWPHCPRARSIARFYGE
jgi:hypothetical protein